MPIALLTVLFVLTLAFAVLTGTTVFSTTTEGVAEAAEITIATITLDNLKSGVGGVDAVDDYTSVGGGWSTRGITKESGNIYVYESYTARICYTIPAGYKATSATYSATFGSTISFFQLRKEENGSYYVTVANNVDSVDGTLDFGENYFVEGDEFRILFGNGKFLISDLTITLKGVALSSPVTITKGTGVKSVYLSTSSTATSGSASGTEFTNDSTVYGFAELAKGYKAKSSWTKVSGTADTEGAKYRVGSAKAGSSNIGTVSADVITYTIGYTLNGGSVSGTNPPSYNVTTNNFTLINPTRTGYTFTGWTGSNGSAPQTSVSVAKGSTGNKTYTANWTPINYTIGYTLNGGTATNPTSYNIETATFTLNNPTRTGYTFAGWTGSNGSTPQTSVSVAKGSTGNKTYTANWTANKYTVTLDDNNGSGGPGSVEVYFDSNFAPIAEAQLPTKAGYTFAGYYDEQNADGVASPSGTLYILGTGASNKAWDKPNDATLYAYYTKDMTVSSEGYEADYDGDSHTITVTVTDPESGYSILYRDPETSSNTNVNPAKKNVGSYTIDFYVNKAGYTQYQGSATIVIKEVDKTALTDPLATDDEYYNNIKDDYSSIASDLKDVIDNIKNNIRDNANVTAADVAQAVANLQTALSTAKVHVTEAKIDAIGSGDYSDEKAADIAEARDYFDNVLSDSERALVNADKLTALEDAEALYGPVGEVVAEINALQTITDLQAFKTAVQTARAHYEALDPNMQAVFPDDDLDDLVDCETIIPVVEKVNALGTPEDTDAFRTAVSSAKADYESLSANQQALFPDSALKVLTDDEAVVSAMDTIKALSEPADTPEFRNAVSAARTQFDALTDDQEEIFPASVKKVLTDDEAVIVVMNEINALGAPADTDAFRTDVEDARDGFDALSDDQKAIFPADVLKTLEDDEAIIAAMDKINAIGDIEFTPECKALIKAARDAYDKLSKDQKEEFPADALKVLEDDEAAYDAMINIDALGKPENTQDFRDKTAGARSFYNGLTDDQKDLVDPDFVKVLEDDEAVIDFMDKVNAIGTPEDTQSFRDKVAEALNVCDNELTPNQLALVPEDVIKALTDDEALVPVMDAIGAIGNPANTDAFREASSDARDVYAALTDDQKAIFPADAIKTLEDNEAVIEVLDEIDSIGNVEYSEGSEALIDAARSAYDSLSADQKAKFPTADLKTLVDDEKAYETMDVVYNIGEIENNAETKERIEDARAAYDALTPDQKALVDPSFVKDLEDSEAVYDAIEQINAIGEIGYDSSSEEAIANARKAYDALSPEQKALMPQETVTALEADEQTYAAKSGDAKKLYIALLVVVAIALCASICFLCFQFIKGKKGKKQEKVMSSVLALPVILAASYYASAPFLAIYILAGLLVVSIVANIAVAMSNKKKKEASKAQKAKQAQKAKKQADEPHDDAKNYVCIADDSEPTYDLRHDPVEEPSEEPEQPEEEPEQAEEPVEAEEGGANDGDNSAEEPAQTEEGGATASVDSAEEPEKAQDEQEPEQPAQAEEVEQGDEVQVEEEQDSEAELEQEEEPAEELETVEDVKVEEPVTLKQSMSVARHNVGHKSHIGKEFCANYLEEKYKDCAETNRRDNFTSTGLPLADTHYALGDKSRKCFVYVYDLEETSMLLLNSDEELASELNRKHGNVHKSAFPKSKDQWYSVALDDSYTEEEVKDALDRCFKHAGGKFEEELSLKESLALAKNVKAEKTTHTTTKKSVCEYLAGKYGDEVALNTRDNYTSTGLPLADTHYVHGEDGKDRCFVYVYETQGSMMLLVRANYDFAKALKKNHPNVHKSAFPKSKEPWNSIILDDSFSDEEVHKLLDDVIALNK